MSVITGFNFQAYSRDLVRESHRAKESIAMSVLSSADMRRLSVVECQVSCGREIPGQPWKPVPANSSTLGTATAVATATNNTDAAGSDSNDNQQQHQTLATLWDNRLGNFNMKPFPVQACATCAEVNEGFSRATRANDRCGGHYGIVSMPVVPGTEHNTPEQGGPQYLYAYAPLLFEELVRLARTQCFMCNDFRAPPSIAFRYLCALTLFDIGLVGDALHFLQAFPASGKPQQSMRRNRFTEDGEEIEQDNDDEDDVENADGNEEEGSNAKKNNNKKSNNNKKEAALTAEAELMQKMEQHVADCRDRAKRDGLLPKKSELEAQQRTVTDLRNDLVKECIAFLGAFTRICRRCGAESPNLSTKQGQIYANWPLSSLTKNVANGLMTAEQRSAIEMEMQFFSRQRVRLDPSQVRYRLYNLFNKNEQSAALLAKLYPHLGEPNDSLLIPQPLARNPGDAYDLFFLNCVLVSPLHLRLAQGVEVQEPSGKLSPDDGTRKLSDIISFSGAIHDLLIAQNQNNSSPQYSHDVASNLAKQLESNLCNLQLKVNELYTRVLDSFSKKQGLFRNNMMGKRVNQACRSVISPDFTVEPNQLLLPRSFARKLSFPETVTTHSTERFNFLKRCVINGPYVYPGAVTIEIRKPGGFVEVKSLTGRSIQEKDRAQLAKECFALARPGSGYQVIVHRHVVDEDRVIFNRQPTLHKVSMMSFRARVLSGLKTIRFHYVSAKSFNADFDGDEMNVHIPQGLDCRAEMETIMDSNLNYLLPTSGKPIRGLIQDHNGAGVLLAARDKFFNFDDFVQLALLGIAPYIGVGPHAMKQLQYILPLPAVLKPVKMWTGKQLFSVLFRFISMSTQEEKLDKMNTNSSNKKKTINLLHGISSKRATQVYSSAWAYPKTGKPITPDQFASKLPDNPVIVLNSELLVGVLDKSQTGPTNLSIAHIVYDVFGPHHVGVFFGALGRLLTYGLQREGFSMGVDDMLMNDEKTRSQLLREIDVNAAKDSEPMGYINQKASELQKHFFPLCLRVPFPHNQLVMMTITGAKGSPTNAVQMNLVIGQQTFDSKRIDRSLSGKTLPSFFVGDQRARSFGFAMGRFVSGIRPAEYTITAMAGRVGLIDTAIKTARSGELERCLMKGLESVKVHWGGVVRDGDGGLIQPRYGGDGLDPIKTATIKEFDMLSRNAKVILSSLPEAFRNENALSDDLKPIYDNIIAQMLKDKSIPHTKKSDRELSEVIKARLEWMRVDAGEPVGVLASQALGEPSTQMTLNTFHSVGTTVSHVSQGIPRLRELMIHASVGSPAVFLPITSTNSGELDAVEEIKALMTPMQLQEFLPKNDVLPSGENLRWSVSRPPGVTEVVLALAFDSHALTRHRLACRVSVAEHVDNFRMTLKKFATRFRGFMIGKRNPLKSSIGVAKNSSGGEDGSGADPRTPHTTRVGADALYDGPDFENVAERMMQDDDDDDDNNNMMMDDDDDEDLIAGFSVGGANRKSSAMNSSKNTGATSTAGKKSGKNASTSSKNKKSSNNNNKNRDDSSGDDDSDDDDSDNDSEISYPDSGSGDDNNSENNNNNNNENATLGHGNGNGGDSDDDDEDDVIQNMINNHQQQQRNSGYDTFQDIVNDKLRFSVNVASRCSHNGPVFSVAFRFNLPQGTLGVVPDMVQEALECTKFHSTFPQVEQVSYHPASAHQKVAQLVFKGEGCRLRQIAQVVAPFSVMSPGLAVDQMTTSDHRDMLNTFGVEAAYHALFGELKELFKGYSVDHRHLSLVAEVATHHGLWKPFRFSGIAAHSSSPLYQMTVAASGKFLRTAITRGVTDSVESVSSSIMTGERPRLGTASANVSRSSAAQNAVVQERLHSILKPMKKNK